MQKLASVFFKKILALQSGLLLQLFAINIFLRKNEILESIFKNF